MQGIIPKGKVKLHTYIVPLEGMWPSYLQNALHYLPSRATLPNLGVKIPGCHQHTPCRVGLDLSAL